MDPGVSRPPSPAARALAVRIARCEVMSALLEGASGDARCKDVVLAQWHEDVSPEARARRWRSEHQLPEPWSGDLEGARILAVSSNPGAPREPIGPGVPTPARPATGGPGTAEHPSLAHGSRYPRDDFRDEEVVDYFHSRFKLRITADGRHRNLDGSPGADQPFWRTVIRAAREIVPGLVPGEDLALTELVHCKSRSEGAAMPRAVGACVGRYLEAVLELSEARVVLAIGSHAWRVLGVGRGECRVVDLGGRERMVLGLLHPAAFGRPKRPSDALDSASLAALCAYAAGEADAGAGPALSAPPAPPAVRSAGSHPSAISTPSGPAHPSASRGAPSQPRPRAGGGSRFDAYRDTSGGSA